MLTPHLTPHNRTLEVRPGRITKKLELKYDGCVDVWLGRCNWLLDRTSVTLSQMLVDRTSVISVLNFAWPYIVSSFAILSGRTRYAHARFSRRTRVDGSAGPCLEIGDTFDQLGLAAV